MASLSQLGAFPELLPGFSVCLLPSRPLGDWTVWQLLPVLACSWNTLSETQPCADCLSTADRFNVSSSWITVTLTVNSRRLVNSRRVRADAFVVLLLDRRGIAVAQLPTCQPTHC